MIGTEKFDAEAANAIDWPALNTEPLAGEVIVIVAFTTIVTGGEATAGPPLRVATAVMLWLPAAVMLALHE